MKSILESPATLYVTAPDGSHAGYDPSTGELVMDFPVAVSDLGDEPFHLIILEPGEGNYLFDVVGTGSGSYTLSVQADGEEFRYSGILHQGERHQYNITFEPPTDADTDHDGIQDGVEDANQYGVVDAGETDPLNPDTDADGVPNGCDGCPTVVRRPSMGFGW